jgi:type I restriction enzyme S subunit
VARGKKAAADAGPVEGRWDLPTGWRWERLGDVGEWFGGGTPSKAVVDYWTDGDIPWISPKDMKRFDLDDTEDHITSAAVAGSSTKLVPAGSVVCVMRSGILKHSFPVAVTARQMTLNQDLRAVHPRRDVSARYLGYFLQSAAQTVLHECAKDGTTVDSIDVGRLMQVPVPLPTDPRLQETIAHRIDALFAEIDQGEAALAEARAGLETYRKSLLKAAVTGELTADWRRQNPPRETGAELLRRILAERRARWHADPKNARKKYVEPAGPDTVGLPELPDGWLWASLMQLGEFGRGKSKHRPRNDPRLYGGPYPFIQTGVVASSDGEIDRFEQTYSEMGLSQSKLWPASTVCITIAANIAKTGVLMFDACFPDSVVGLTCAEGINPRYVELFIRTVREELDRWAPATAQKNINLETLCEVPVPLPPTSEQGRIALLAKQDTGLDSVVEDAGTRELASTLRQSILAAAFRGELTA